MLGDRGAGRDRRPQGGAGGGVPCGPVVRAGAAAGGPGRAALGPLVLRRVARARVPDGRVARRARRRLPARARLAARAHLPALAEPERVLGRARREGLRQVRIRTWRLSFEL